MASIRPGDWQCASCHNHVYASNQACKKCGAPKSAGTEYSEESYGTKGGGVGVYRPGDWVCPNPMCNNHVFSFNQTCRKCGTEKPVGADADPEILNLKPGYRPGDWQCPNPSCGDKVYSRNSSCRKCGTQKPTLDAFAPSNQYQQQFAGPSGYPAMDPYATGGFDPYFAGHYDPAAAAMYGGGYGQFGGNFMGMNDQGLGHQGMGHQGMGHQGMSPLGMGGPSVDVTSTKPPGFRHGDWMCPNPACNNHVYSNNKTCKKCGTPKSHGYDEFGGGGYGLSVGLMGGVGGVGGVGGYGGVSRGPVGVGGFGDVGGKGGTGKPAFRPGDWYCPNPSCRNHVFSFNSKCRKCGMEKPANAPEASEVAAAMGSGVPSVGKAGAAESGGAGASRYPAGYSAADFASKLPPGYSPAEIATATAAAAAMQGASTSGTSQYRNPHDWQCPNCKDHVFASRPSCRRCGTNKAGEAPTHAAAAPPWKAYDHRGAEGSGVASAGATPAVSAVGGKTVKVVAAAKVGGELPKNDADEVAVALMASPIKAVSSELGQLVDGGTLVLCFSAYEDLTQGPIASISRRTSEYGIDLQNIIRSFDPTQQGVTLPSGVVVFHVPPLPANPLFKALVLVQLPFVCYKASLLEIFAGLRDSMEAIVTQGGTQITSNAFEGIPDASPVDLLIETAFFLKHAQVYGSDLYWQVFSKDPLADRAMRTIAGLRTCTVPTAQVIGVAAAASAAGAKRRTEHFNSHPGLAQQLEEMMGSVNPRCTAVLMCMTDLQRVCAGVESDKDVDMVCIGALRVLESMMPFLMPAGESVLLSREAIVALKRERIFFEHLSSDYEAIVGLGGKYIDVTPGEKVTATMYDSDIAVRAVLRLLSDPRQVETLQQRGVLLEARVPLSALGGGEDADSKRRRVDE